MDTIVTRQLETQDMDYYKQGIEKIIPQRNECLNYGGNYMEK
jgi:hypothetical protein